MVRAKFPFLCRWFKSARRGGEVVKCCKNFTKAIDVKFCKIELNVVEPLAIMPLEQDETR